MKRFFICSLFILLMSSIAFASGSFVMPTPNKFPFFKGEKLFTTDKLVGEGGKKCLDCHGTKKLRLKRSKLKKKIKELPDLINKCIKDHVKAKELKSDDEQLEQLMVYIKEKYKLE